jgi:glucose-6-phosphate dehydrogenase assembly protein OpcA
VVAIASASALADVHTAFGTLARTSGVRPIVVTFGEHPEPVRTQHDRTVVLEGLVPHYLNNAVAALRLSSLPAIGWWRAPSLQGLLELCVLVDRLVLDVEDPAAVWSMVPELSTRTAVSDLRWTRLTRWRDLFAQFFDLPEVRDRSDAFSALNIVAGDAHMARLLAGWIVSRLPSGERLAVSIASDAEGAAIRSLALTGGEMTLSLRLLPNNVCLETTVALPGTAPATRVVSTGDQALATLMSEELRVRSRDQAFEDAIAAARALPGGHPGGNQ